jgi:hypothetical protein
LDHGRVVESGDADRVINTYNFLLAKKSEGQEIKLRTTNKRGKSYGNFKVEIVHIKMLNAQGHDGEVFVSGQPCTIHIMLKAQEPVDEITVGILIQDKFGQDIFGTNTYHLKTPIMLTAGRDCLVQYTIDELNIGPGQYSLTVAAHTADCHIHECYHWVDMIRTFQIVSPQKDCFIGIARLSPSVRVYSELQRTVIDKPLAPDVYKAELSCIESPMCCIDRNTIVSLPVKIKNASRGPWPALGGPDGRHWIKLAYHILDAHEHIIIFDGIRTTLPGDLAPQQEVIVQARVQAPDRPGAYIIEFDVVQEMVSWFATRGSKTMRIAIQVR